jgi:hypothetical protein
MPAPHASRVSLPLPLPLPAPLGPNLARSYPGATRFEPEVSVWEDSD